MTVTGTNDGPVATDDTATTDEDASVNINVLANDTDIDGDTLSVVDDSVSILGGAGGDVVLNDDGTVTFTPDDSFDDLDDGESRQVEIEYTITDGDATSTATATVTVTGSNDGPVATDDTASVDEDASVNINVLANDTDKDNDSLSVVSGSVSVLGGAAGAAVLNDDGTISFTPGDSYNSLADGETETVEIEYTVTDGDETSTATATVTVTGSNDGPVASADSFEGTEDNAITFTSADLLANDTDADTTDTLSITDFEQPENGTLTYDADTDTFTFTPDENWSGETDFTYTVDDGNGGTSTATVTLEVEGVADAPTLEMDDLDGTEDTALALDIDAALVDTDGSETLSLVIEDVPEGASLNMGTDNGDGTWTISGDDLDNLDGLELTPPENFNGDFSLTVTATATEENGDTATTQQTLDISIDAVNDGPVAVDDTGTTGENATLTLDVTANDTDIDGDTLTASNPTLLNDAGGSVSIDDDGNLVFDPGSDFDSLADGETATVEVEYTVSDGAGGTDTGVATITVTGSNDGPVASAEEATTDEDSATSGQLSATDAEGDDLTFALDDAPEKGTVTVNADGSYTYTPSEDLQSLDDGESTTDTFTFTVTDENGATTTETATVTITGSNDGPVVADESFLGDEDTAITFTTADLLGNDTDIEGDSLSITAFEQPDNGTVTYDADTDTYTFTPDEDWSGETNFEYTVSDGTDTSTGTVTLDVEGVADAPNLEASIGEGTVNDGSGGSGGDGSGFGGDLEATGTSATSGDDVLILDGLDQNENISAQNGDDVVVINGDAQGGNNINLANGDDSVIFNGDIDGNVAVNGANGNDTVYLSKDEDSYQINNMTNNNGTISAQVVDLETGNTLTLNNVEAIAFGDGGSIGDESLIDWDLQNGGEASTTYPLDISASLNDLDGSESLSITVDNLPEGATLSAGTVNDDGSISLDPDDLDGLTITVPAGAGDVALEVSATATEDNGDTATVTTTVSFDSNTGPVATDDTATTDEDASVTINVLANDTDLDGDTLSVVDDSLSILDGAGGDVVLNDDGTVSFTPDASFDDLADGDTRTVEIEYTVTDGTSTDTATATVTVTGSNDGPVATDDTATVDEDASVTINVLANDTDVDQGDTVSVVPGSVAIAGGAAGEAVLNDDGTISFTPGDSYNSLAEGESETVEISYQVTDEAGETSTATATVTVTGSNDGPVASADSFEGTEDTAITFTSADLLGNDTDADTSDTLSVASFEQPDNGTLTYDADSDTFTFTPDENWSGETDFTYTVDDGNGGTSTATVTLDVDGVADAPTIDLSDAAGTEDTVIALDLDSALVDTDGSETLSVTIDDVPNGASLNLGTDNGDGSWTISGDDLDNLDSLELTPPTNFNGEFTLNVTATSTEENGDTATTTQALDVSVAAANDGPVANDDTGSTGENAVLTLDITANDTDLDGDTLTASDPTLLNDAGGSVSIDDDGNLVFDPGSDFDSLGEGDTATVEVQYTVSDGAGGSDTGVATITVTGSNDGPVASADSFSGTEDSTITFTSADLLSNDSDADGDSLTVTAFEQPDNGTLVYDADSDTFTFTPNDDWSGETDFEYTVSDGTTTSTGTATLDVEGVADAPDLSVSLGDEVDSSGQASGGGSSSGSGQGQGQGSNSGSGQGQGQGSNSGSGQGQGRGSNSGSGQGQGQGSNSGSGQGQGGGSSSGGGSGDAAETTYELNLSADLTDTDGSESLSAITVTNVPDGVTFSAGTENEDGSWTIEQDELTDLEITIPDSLADNFDLQFSVTSTEADGDTATTTRSLSVDANDGPVANDDTATTGEDSSVTVNVLANDTDADGDTLTVVDDSVSILGGAGGSVVLNDDGTISFTPDDSFDSLDDGESTTVEIEYTVTDGSATDTATATVTVTGSNDGPVASDDTATVDEDSTVKIDVVANDTDVDGDNVSVVPGSVAVLGGAAGVALLDDDGQISFDTDGAFNDLGVGESETVEIEYQVTDGDATSTATATVTVTGSNDGPVANADSFDGTEDQTITFTSADLLGNDTDADTSDTLSIASFEQPENGTLTYDADSDTFTFTPDDNWSGDTDFTYTVSDGEGGEATATVTLSVDADADGATLTVQDAEGLEDTAFGLDISAGLPDSSETLTEIVISDVPDGASLNLGTDNGNGTWTISGDDLDNLDGLELTPPEDSNADFTLTVSATTQDGDDTQTTETTLEVDMTGVADAPTLTASLGDEVENGSDDTNTYELDISSALSDTDGSETLSITVDGLPDGASLSAGTENDDGSWTLESGDLSGLTVTLPGDADAFDLQVSATATENDGDTNTVTSTISLDAQNAGPEANDDTATTSENASVDIDVLDNDTDADGDALTVSNPTILGESGGSVSIDDDGNLEFDPGEDFNSLAVGESETVEIVYTVSDGTATDTATATVTVTGSNDGPVVEAEEAATGEDSAVSGTLSASDVDGDDLTFAAGDTSPSYGSVTVNADGSYTYTPGDAADALEEGETATDTFTFTVTDENGATATETATITLTGSNDGPVAVDETVSVSEDAQATGQLDASDVDGDDLTFEVTDAPAQGSVTVNADGSYTYTPGASLQSLDDGETATDTFTYTVTDDQGATSTATATVTITGSNDGPVATDDTATTDEDQAVSINVLGNDTDADGDSLSVTGADIAGGAGGSVVVNDDGTISFTPDSSFDSLNDGESQDVEIVYTVSDGTTTDTATATVTVTGSNDGPVATTSEISGDEDGTISGTLGGTDVDSDNLTFSAGDTAPSNGTLTVNADGSYTYEPDADWSGTDTFSYKIDDGDGGVVEQTVTVTVDGVVDDPTVTANDVSGDEDTAIELDLSAALGDSDGSESITAITLSGIPDGAVLAVGGTEIDVTDGEATLTSDQLSDLTITPAEDSNVDFDLTIAVTAEENGQTSTTTETFTVDVVGVADDPSVTASIGDGTLSIIDDTADQTITGSGSTENLAGGSGDDTIHGGSSGEDFISGGIGDDVITASGGPDDRILGGAGDDTITSQGAGDLMIGGSGDDTAYGNDGNDLYVMELGGGNDSFSGGSGTDKIALLGENGLITDINDVTITMTNGSYSTGTNEYGGTEVNFSNGATGTITMSDGSTVTFDGVESLQLNDHFNYDDSWEHVRTVTENGGSVSGAEGDMNFFGSSGNDTITGGGNEDFVLAGAGDDTISTGSDEDHLVGGAGDDVMDSGSHNDMLIGGAGDDTLDGGDGTDTAVFSGNREQYNIVENDDGSFTVTDLVANRDGTDTVTNVEKFEFADGTVNEGDILDNNPSSLNSGVEGTETIYELDIAAALSDTDGSESLSSVTISGVPDGVSFSAGTDNEDGSWTIDAGDLDGLTLHQPYDVSSGFDITISATSTEDDGDTATTSVTLQVGDEPPADATASDPSLSANTVSGTEDTAIDLDISAALTDTDGSESLAITIGNIPDGATLMAGDTEIMVTDGSADVTAEQLDSLTITPPEDSSDNINLTVTATSTESSTGDTATQTTSFTVNVAGDADAPTLSVSVGEGTVTEGSSGTTPVAYWQLDESSGSTVSDSVGSFHGTANGSSGSWDWDDDEGQHDGAAEFDGSKNERYVEVDHDPALKPDSGTLTMWIKPDHDNKNMGLASSDSSGYDDGGHFTLRQTGDSIELRMQDENSSYEVEGGDIEKNSWNQVTVSWGEDGMKLYVNGELVDSNPDYTGGLGGNEEPWIFGANQWSSGDETANNLSEYFDGHMDDIAIYDSQLSDDQIEDLFDNGVDAMMESGDSSDGTVSYPVTISSSLTDTDGSETLSITVDNLPDGATLSAGTENDDGSWTLSADDLSGLTMTVPSGSSDFDLNVTATATEADGDTASVQVTASVTLPEAAETGLTGDSGDTGSSLQQTQQNISIDEPGSWDRTGDNNHKGYSGDDNIAGTSGNDKFWGDDTWTQNSDGDDTIFGYGGKDTIYGQGGDDALSGGDGDDKLYGDDNYYHNADGTDTIDGGDGNDSIQGGGGGDTLLGGDGNDKIWGGLSGDENSSSDGADYIDGGAGKDTIEAGAGADTVFGGEGDDKIYGQSNDNYYSSNDGGDYLDGGAGNDTIEGGAGDDIIMGGTGDDKLYGGIDDNNDWNTADSGNDTLVGGEGDDSAWGGGGNDLFIFGSGDGSDYFDGGSGWTDTVQLEDVTGGPGGDSGWTLETDVDYTVNEDGSLTFDEEASGTVQLDDGSELTFQGVEKIEW
ncbi:MAG: Ig-like domain-containing protein [Magnetovibrionaceae bacterium]